MTESEWLACTDPKPMLDFLNWWAPFVWGRASDRKLRLFACACCRRVWHLAPHDDTRGAVEAAERFADGGGTAADLLRVHVSAAQVFYDYLREGRQADREAARADCSAAATAAWTAANLSGEWSLAAEVAGGVNAGPARADLLRDIFGNPFRPATVLPPWQTPQAVGLAQATYDERELPAGTLDPARLAVLADALEDAGCDEADLLGHLRGPGPHVRGCWAVDLILGKQ
jgi:hypothetical protein